MEQLWPPCSVWSPRGGHTGPLSHGHPEAAEAAWGHSQCGIYVDKDDDDQVQDGPNDAQHGQNTLFFALFLLASPVFIISTRDYHLGCKCLYLPRQTNREEHPEAGGGRAGHAAEPQPGPGPGRGSQRKARRRRERWPRVPASFSQAARTHWSLPAEAGHRAPELDRTAHVPVRGWRGVRVAGLSAGDTWGLLMPRAWARRKISATTAIAARVAHLAALRVVHTSWGVGGGGDVGVPTGEG